MKKDYTKCQGFYDPYYPEAEEFCKQESRYSTAAIQRKFSIGYLRASRIYQAICCKAGNGNQPECATCEYYSNEKSEMKSDDFENKKLTDLRKDFIRFSEDYGINLTEVADMPIISKETLKEKFHLSNECAEDVFALLIIGKYAIPDREAHRPHPLFKSIFCTK